MCLYLRRRRSHVAYSQNVERVFLQLPHSLAEETRPDQEEEVGHHDQEDCKSGARGKSVDQETASEATDDAYDGGEGNRCGGFTKGDTTNENDGFETYLMD